MRISRSTVFSIIAGLAASYTVIAADNSSQKNTHQHVSNAQTSAGNSKSSGGQTVAFSKLPAPVQKTMHSEAPGVNIENIHKISKNGQTCYEGSFDKPGIKGRLTVAEDGSLLQYQESAGVAMFEAAPDLSARGKSKMQLADLPQPVRDAVKQRAGSNQAADIFKTTEAQSGKTAYHVAYNDGVTLTDLLLDENGNVLYRADQTALFAAPVENSQTLTFQTAPQNVQNAIRQYGGSAQTVSDVDKGTWNGQTVYKVMVEKNGSFRPLLVSENGQIIRPGSSQSASTGSAARSQQGGAHDSQTNESSDSTRKTNK